MIKGEIQRDQVDTPSIWTCGSPRTYIRKVKGLPSHMASKNRPGPKKSLKRKAVSIEDDPSYSEGEDEDEILRKQKKVPGYRCSPHMIRELFKKLSSKQKGWVKKIKFDPLQDMIDCGMPKSLTMWLVDRVDTSNGTLEICGTPIDIREAAVQILKLPCGHIRVPRPLNGRSKAKRPLGESSSTELKHSNKGRGQTAKDATKGLLAENDDEVAFCQSFVMLVLCIYLAPTTSLNINRNYYPALMDVSQIALMDWCGFIVDYLIQGIEDYRNSKASHVQVPGCVHILPLIYIDALIKKGALKLPQSLTIPDGEHSIHSIGTGHLSFLASADVKSRSKEHIEYGLLQESQNILCAAMPKSNNSGSKSQSGRDINPDEPVFYAAGINLKLNEVLAGGEASAVSPPLLNNAKKWSTSSNESRPGLALGGVDIVETHLGENSRILPLTGVEPGSLGTPLRPNTLGYCPVLKSPNEDQEQQLPQPSDLNDDGVDKFLSSRAKRIKGMLDDCLQTLVHKGPKFPTTLLPALTAQEQRSLDLPKGNLTARLHAGCVRMGLQEIQELLRQKPLNKAGIVEAIEASTSAWSTQYKGSAPDGVKELISLLETLAMRLEGKAPPSLFGEEIVSLANMEARPLLGKLGIAVTSVMEEVKLLREEEPGLEELISTNETLQCEHEQQAKELDRQAADARKKAKEFRKQQRTAAAKLECLRIATSTFHEQTEQLKLRADEVTEFLKLFQEEQKKANAEEPPEAALILTYSCNSLESST